MFVFLVFCVGGEKRRRRNQSRHPAARYCALEEEWRIRDWITLFNG